MHLCFLNCLLDIFLAHVGRRLDSDLLLSACALILSAYVYDTVSVDIESNFDLRYATGCRCDTVENEVAQCLVVCSHLTLALEYVNFNLCLAVSCRGEYLALLCRDRCVTLDHLCAYAAHCLDTE